MASQRTRTAEDDRGGILQPGQSVQDRLRESATHSYTTGWNAPLIDGRIDTVSPDGVVHGWLRDTQSTGPRHVQVIHGNRLAGEALAHGFRPDLLLAGYGHGHHGFQARLKVPLPQGACELNLHVPATGLRLPATVLVPALQPPRPITVETLLQTVQGWTASDLLMRPACLDMTAHHAVMGTLRFVDAVFRFVLNRWPSPAEARLHAVSLRAGHVDPESLLVECLTSRERADMPPRLTSPYDVEFPFGQAAGAIA